MTVVPSQTPGSETDGAATVPTARAATEAGEGTDPASTPASASGSFLARAALVTASLSIAGLAARAGARPVAGAAVRRRERHGRLSGGVDRSGVRRHAAHRGRAGDRADPGVQHGTGPPRPGRPGRSGPRPGRVPPCPGCASPSPRWPRWSPARAPYLVQALAPGLPDPRSPWTAPGSPRSAWWPSGSPGTAVRPCGPTGASSRPRRSTSPTTPASSPRCSLLGEGWGVRSAAVGVAAGGCLMVAVQLPSLWRRLASRTQPFARSGADVEERPMQLALVAAVLLFALCRQSQVLIERFLASGLPAGAISHLNYAQKVAQIPMTLSLMVCTVTFPVVARALADGDIAAGPQPGGAGPGARRLPGAAGHVRGGRLRPADRSNCSSSGARSPRATPRRRRTSCACTPSGCSSQTLVGALVRSYFSAGRATWYPLGAMAGGHRRDRPGIGAASVRLLGRGAGSPPPTPPASPSRPPCCWPGCGRAG